MRPDAPTFDQPSRVGRLPAARRVAWIVYLALGLAAAALYAAIPNLDHRWLFPLFGIGASGAVFVGVFLHRPTNAGRWIGVGGGIALLALGDLTYSVLEQARAGAAPLPPIADAIYLVGYGVLALGLAGLVGGRRGGRDIAAMLDALIVAASAGVVAWVAFLSGTITDGGLNPGDAVALVHPFMDFVLLAIAVRIVLAPAGMGIGRLFLVVGTIAYLASDFAYTFATLEGSGTFGGLVDPGWAIGYVLWGAAALHPRMVQSALRPPRLADVRRSSARLVGLGAAMLIPPVLLWLPGVATSPEKLYGVAVTSTALTVFVLFRIAHLFGDINASIIERRRLEGRLRHAADHDPLVGLWNRRVFHDRLADMLAIGDERLAALFIDVDDFKRINDTAGHAAGDVVLAELASRIERALRPSDLAARLGGDEFGVILPDCATPDAARAIADRLLLEIAAPITVLGREFTVTASIGVAEAREAADTGSLMRNADIAMYLAKERGKNRVESYEEGAHVDVVRRLQLRTDLEHALAAGQFALVYQPIVDLASGSMVGVEALLRWDHPERGRLNPADFLAMLEEQGRIVPVGRWVVKEACRQLGVWKRRYPTQPLYVSVNLSPLQLRDPATADDIERAIGEAGIAAADLVVEITESVVLDIERSLPILARLRARGVRVALDDFGTGYSTITNLVKVPLDIMKIDQSFIAPLETGGRSAALVENLLQIASSMGVEAIAEGIEVSAQREALVGLGCRLGQGFLMGFPADPSAVTELLSAQVAATRRPRVPARRSAYAPGAS
ncbi:MAG: EAL domain-containing protein [Chloroflexi bacterium]|nr:EAL domain-containing protein [Chloroflexota bacterium]